MNKCIPSTNLKPCEARGPIDTSVLEDKCFGLKCLIIELSYFFLRAGQGISVEKIRSAVLLLLKWRMKESVTGDCFTSGIQRRLDGYAGEN